MDNGAGWKKTSAVCARPSVPKEIAAKIGRTNAALLPARVEIDAGLKNDTADLCDSICKNLQEKDYRPASATARGCPLFMPQYPVSSCVSTSPICKSGRQARILAVSRSASSLRSECPYRYFHPRDYRASLPTDPAWRLVLTPPKV